MRAILTGVLEAGPDTDLLKEHDRSTQSHLVLEGWAFRYIALADGRRQILAVHVPGDFVDLHSLPLQVMDHSVATFTPARIAVAPHERLRRLTEDHPHLARLLWLSTLVDAAIHRQWLVGAGQRSAREQAAHLMCELYVRLELIGEANDGRFTIPMSQAEFADALAVSSVHTNRVLQELRAEGVMTWRGRDVSIRDWDRLVAIAGFDPVYLNLFDARR